MSDIHSFVLNLLGTLPIELSWLYALSDFVILITIICICVSPFLLVYSLVKR